MTSGKWHATVGGQEVAERIKVRPCLRCDQMTPTTTGYRLCAKCRTYARGEGNAGYSEGGMHKAESDGPES
jgi:hypothetical protein